jgi:hypothetical protein
MLWPPEGHGRDPQRSLAVFADLRRTLWMTVPGMIGLIATTGLVAGFIGDLSDSDAAKFVIFLQVELLAMGVGRLGLEQLVLSRASEMAKPDTLSYLGPLRLVIPLGIALSAAFAVVLSDVRGISLIAVVPLDMLSSVVAAFELGRRHYRVPIALAWLNYPLFVVFLVVPVLSINSDNLRNVVTLFVATSVLRGGLAIVLLVRHHRSLERTTVQHLLTRDATASGTVNVVQTVIQRFDGIVLSAFSARFTSVSVTRYLLSTRLLDASYAMSTIVGSLRQVSKDQAALRLGGMRRIAPVAGWFGLWVLAAIVLAEAPRPDRWDARWELALGVIGSSMFIGTVRITLGQLGRGENRRLIVRHLSYLGTFVICAAVAVVTGRPWVMLVSAVLCGAASLLTLGAETDRRPPAATGE